VPDDENPPSRAAWLSIASPAGGGTHLRISGHGDRWVVDGIYLHAPEITATALQRVPVNQVDLAMNLGGPVDLEALKISIMYGGLGVPVLDEPPEPTLAELRKQSDAAPRELRLVEPLADRPRLGRPDGTDPDGFYAEVARAYIEYARQTRAPAPEIAREAGVPAGTARGWVKEARRRGHLRPGRKGKAG
jgi:hypothetical protein